MSIYYDAILEKITSLGLVVSPQDELLIKHLISKVDSYTRSICNFTDAEPLPSLLTPYFVDRVYGAYVYEKLKSGQLDVETAIKSIKEGDTAITYAYGDGAKSDETRLEELCEELNNQYRTVAMRYRRLAW